MKKNKETRNSIAEMIETKQRILNSYKDGELEEKRPDIYARLTRDIKALNLVLDVIDDKVLTPSQTLNQLQSMIYRNLSLEEDAEVKSLIGKIMTERDFRNMDFTEKKVSENNAALSESAEIIKEYSES